MNPSTTRPLWQKATISVIAVAAAFAVRMALHPILGSHSPYLVFTLAVTFAAWHGGLWLGLATTALSAAVGAYYFVAPSWYPFPVYAHDILRLWLFLAIGSLTSALGEAVHAARRRAADSAEDARNHLAAARDSERRLANILDSTMDAIITVNADHRIVLFNAAAERMFRTSSAEVMGQTLDRFIPAHARSDHAGHIRRFADTGTTSRSMGELGTLHALRADGEEFPIEATISQAGSHGDSLFTVVLRDVTQRLRNEEALQRSEQRFRTALRHAPIIFSQVDRDLRYTWISNPHPDFRPEDLVGKRDDEMDSGPGIAALMNLKQRVLASEAGSREVIAFERSDGRHVYDITAEPLRDGNGAVVGLTVAAVEITGLQRAESALKASEERFRAVFQQAAVGIEQVGLDGRLLEVNGRACSILGYTRGELLGRSVMEITHPDDREREKALIAELLAGVRDSFTSEKRYLRGDGELVWVRLTSSLAHSPDGQRYRISVVEDITEARRRDEALGETEARFRTLADNMSQLAWMADASGWIFWYNRRWFDYTGTTLEEMQGWGWQAVHDPDHMDRVVEHWSHALHAGIPWEDTFPLRGTDGAYRWFLSRALPIRDESGVIVRWFGTNTDITDRLQLEEELRRRADELVMADRAKDEFLAMLGHELRNPMGAISNALELMRLRDPESAETRSYRVLHRQTQHLARLVDDLLDVSRITRGKIELRRERVNLVTLVAQAVQAAEPAIGQNRHDLDVRLPGQPLHIQADPARLEQVVLNLLHNAAKYTQPGGRIEVTLERQSDEAILRVTDTGSGIPEDLLPRVFDLFTQADRTLDRSQGGLGIGLTLVKRLVTMHGGTVTAWSEGTDRGSVFTVRLPLAADAAPEPQRLPGDSEAPQDRPVIRVDDSEQVA